MQKHRKNKKRGIKPIKIAVCGDYAYCLVDSDINKQKETEIFKALRKAKKNHIQLIISNPCFEIWYLCHFVYSTAQYNSNDEVIQKIKEYIPNYSKNLDSVYELISNKTYQAIQNAESQKNLTLKINEKNISKNFLLVQMYIRFLKKSVFRK